MGNFGRGRQIENSGVVHEDIEFSVMLDNPGDCRVNRGLVSHVQPETQMVGPDFMGGVARSGFIDIADHDKRAFLGIALSDRKSDAAGSACNEGDFFGKRLWVGHVFDFRLGSFARLCRNDRERRARIE